MKLITAALVVNAAAAFTTPPLTFAVSKKAPAKKASATKAVVAKTATKAVKKVEKVAKKPAFSFPTLKKADAKPAATKAVAKPVVKKAAPKPAPKVVAKPVAKAAPKAAAKPAPKPAAKPAPKPVAKVVKAVKKSTPPPAQPKIVSKTGTVPSTAIPGEEAPAILDGSLVGDVGFDPCFLSTKADLTANYFNGVTGASVDGLTWYREAELMHGRICMVAVLGFIWPGFGTFAGNEWTGADAFSYTNPLEAFSKAPSASLFQIFAFMSILEFRRINNIIADGPGYMAGDSQKWGQGEGRWNPFGLDYTPEEYKEKQLQELKHARLAMIAFLGLVFQANASGVGVIDQLSAAFVTPDYVQKAGYFLPEGI